MRNVWCFQNPNVGMGELQQRLEHYMRLQMSSQQNAYQQQLYQQHQMQQRVSRRLVYGPSGRGVKACRVVRPPLNKKLFPVHRPGGLKRSDWNFFFHIFIKKKSKKNEIRKKTTPDWPYFSLPGTQETIFYLRVASPLGVLAVGWRCVGCACLHQKVGFNATSTEGNRPCADSVT